MSLFRARFLVALRSIRGRWRRAIGFRSQQLSSPRASGGIGRRAGFRFLCPKGCGGSSPPSRTIRWDRSHNHDQTASPSEKSSPPERLLTFVEPNVADSVDVTPEMTAKKQAELRAKRLRAEDAKTAMVL
jgi:hypothetical protein